MKPSISRCLTSLYGPARADEILAQLRPLLERFRPPSASSSPSPVSRENLALTQRDALLITYADQVRQAGEPPLKTLAEFCPRHLKHVISGVHLLPFYPWSSDDGFSVRDFFRVEPSYGSWADIARLGVDFDLMFDGVFNHVSAQGEWFQRYLANDPGYADFFIPVDGHPDLSQVVRPRALPLLTEFPSAQGPLRIWTTFSTDQVDLNFKNPRVLLAVIEALLFYVQQGARFIRLDAIAFLWKEIGTSCLHQPQTHTVIQLLRAVLDDVAPHVLLITETNVPHTDNVSYFGDGANEAQLVYNFALPPLVLHSFAAGNAQQLTRWAQSLMLPSERVTFFNFLASHDGIGLNPVRKILSDAEIDTLVRRTLDRGGFISYKDMPDGSPRPYEMNINYLDALTNPGEGDPERNSLRKFLTAHAILLSLPGVPGIYFHSLFGSRGDRAGAEASGIKRRVNREKLERATIELELSNPHSRRAKIFAGQRALLLLRRQHAALAPAAAQRVLESDPRVFAVLRQSLDDTDLVLCLHNVSGEPVTANLASLLPGVKQWKPLCGQVQGCASESFISIEPWSTCWLAPASR